jgi:hypothetical protein
MGCPLLDFGRLRNGVYTWDFWESLTVAVQRLRRIC